MHQRRTRCARDGGPESHTATEPPSVLAVPPHTPHHHLPHCTTNPTIPAEAHRHCESGRIRMLDVVNGDEGSEENGTAGGSHHITHGICQRLGSIFLAEKAAKQYC